MLLFDGIRFGAERHPDRPAFRQGAINRTYAEMDETANRVANTLIDLGVAKGDRVALYGHKTLDLIGGLFGILKTGAAYVPINPDAPVEYAAGVITDCDIDVIVGTESRSGRVEKLLDGRRRCLGPNIDGAVSWDAIDRADASAPSVSIGEDDLGYVMFTSGSTGRPKGIMHSHRSGMAYGQVVVHAFGFEPDDRMALHAPLNFDLSTVELFGGTLAGAEIVVVSEGHARLPASLAALLEAERVTIINAVPSALVQLLHRGAPTNRDLSSLRYVLFGGEVFPTRDLRAWKRLVPHARFANIYGPAEVNGITYEIVDDLPEDDTPISIGREYPGVDLVILDEDDEDVAAGEQGELMATAPTQMIGYWDEPEMTARSWYHRDGLRYYRTGDLVRRRADGKLDFNGRKDRQVKVRGHRLELDEIETALIGHPDVEQAVVSVIRTDDGADEIHATVVPFTDRTPPDPAGVRAHVGHVLPTYAVPSEVVVTTEVPRTLSGKPDRLAMMAAIEARRTT
jgi:amino acid adenylation domain-containing protein